jgi:hypothetical protein
VSDKLDKKYELYRRLADIINQLNELHANPDDIRASIDQKFRLLDQLDTLLAEAEQLNEQHLADGGSGPLITYARPHEADIFTNVEIRHAIALYKQRQRVERASGQ